MNILNLNHSQKFVYRKHRKTSLFKNNCKNAMFFVIFYNLQFASFLKKRLKTLLKFPVNRIHPVKARCRSSLDSAVFTLNKKINNYSACFKFCILSFSGRLLLQISDFLPVFSFIKTCNINFADSLQLIPTLRLETSCYGVPSSSIQNTTFFRII